MPNILHNNNYFMSFIDSRASIREMEDHKISIVA